MTTPLPDAARVLGVFARPDDESLAAGGLLAALAERGVATALVTATWADGTPRVGELRAALGHLGAGEPRLLGYADERAPSSAPGRPRLVDAPVEDVVAALVPHVRACRPDVVLTHDVHGGLTGHPDDRRVHEVTVRAVREAASGVLHPHAGPPHCPRRLLLATHPHAARAMLHDLVGTRRTVHTVPDDEAVGLDVTEWLPRKVDAIVAHTSEVDRSALPGLVAAMPRETQERLLGREWYTEMSSALSSGPLASGS